MQADVTKCVGLVIQYNPLQVSDGALIQADNAVIRRENIFENRRGYLLYSSFAAEPSQTITFDNRVLIQQGTHVAYDNGSGTFANYPGSYSPPSGRKMRFQEANSNVYVTTSKGIQAFMDVSGTAGRLAGAPRALDPSFTLSGVTGFLSNNMQTAYRVLIQRTDQNNNVLQGYPSQRMWVTNTSGTSVNVALTIYLPAEAVAGDVLQIYRTQSVAYAGGGTDAAGDEMNLVYQYTLVAADITAGNFAFTDVLIDSLAATNASLYTSPSQEGISQANSRPPLALDIALYKTNTMFYANTTTKQQLYFTLVSTSGLNGTSMTLAGTTYTFSTAGENTAIGQIFVSTTGVVANDIDATARSIIRNINRYASNTRVYAYYVSGADDLPGQIFVEERVVGGSAFTFTVSTTTISQDFFPAPSTTALPATTSSNNIQKNALYYSKTQELEAVPLLNFIFIGPSNTNILRIKALRDSLIIIKEEGIYRLVGETAANFTVIPLDLTVFCKAIDSVDTLANQVFMLSNQGVVAVSDTGVQVVSREIEPKLLNLLTYTSAIPNAFGFAYNSERSYFLALPTNSTDTTNNQVYVYNYFTRAWTRWTFGMGTGIVEPNGDVMYFTIPGNSKLFKERKSFSTADYAEPESTLTIGTNTVSGNNVTVTSSVAPVAGWAVTYAGTTIKISSVQVSGSNYILTMATTPPATWNTTGTGTLWPAIIMTVVWDAWTAGQPGMLKQERYVKIMTDNIPGNTSITSLFATFITDLDSNEEQIEIFNQAFSWGGPWGVFSWGGVPDNYNYPSWLPQNKNYFRVMNPGVIHQNALERCSVAGISHTFEVISERASK